jgi:hypothetical protein
MRLHLAIVVTDRGAVADGKTVNTAILQSAINEVAVAGGGVVTIPPGVFVTGSLQLCSNLTLELLPGAVLFGSPSLGDYPLVSPVDGDRTGRHLLHGKHLSNVTLTGGGRIDGNGPAFWEPTVPGPCSDGTGVTVVAARETDLSKQAITWIRADNAKRPSPMLVLEDCHDIRIEHLTIANSPGWNVHLHHCERVQVLGVTLEANLVGPNNDGLDIMGCSDVLISGCHISCCDDAVCLKTERDGRPCERITVTQCVIRTRCAAFKCGWSDSFADFRQLVFSDCTVFESHRAVALYSVEGAVIEDVEIRNIVCDTRLPIASPMSIHMDLRRRRPDSRLGAIRHITIRNFIARTDGRILLTAADGGLLSDISLSAVQLTYPAIEDATLHGSRGSAQHSQGNPDAMAAPAVIVAENVDHLSIDGLSVRWPPSQDPAWVPAWKAANGEADLIPGSGLYPPGLSSMDLLWQRNVTHLSFL